MLTVSKVIVVLLLGIICISTRSAYCENGDAQRSNITETVAEPSGDRDGPEALTGDAAGAAYPPPPDAPSAAGGGAPADYPAAPGGSAVSRPGAVQSPPPNALGTGFLPQSAGRCPEPDFPGPNARLVSHVAPSCRLQRCADCATRPPDFFVDVRSRRVSYAQNFNDGRYIYAPIWSRSGQRHPGSCGQPAILKVQFPPAASQQRARLRIDFYWAPPASGYFVHVADALNAKAYKPHRGAEFLANHKSVFLFGNSLKGFEYHSIGADGLMFSHDVASCAKFTVTLGDEFLHYDNYKDAEVCIQSPFLFLLRAQCRPFEAADDNSIYIGLNQLVTADKNAPKLASGLCTATLTWI